MSVLSNAGIKKQFTDIFVEGGNEVNIRAAKYYLTLSHCNLILPSGKRYAEGDKCVGDFLIEPGETAFLSTAEKIVMPRHLIGIIGPQFNSAEHGVLFFGGMLVDPGFGLPQGGEPLSFYIANLGAQPIVLRPGRDTIASIAFFGVEDPPGEEELKDPERLGIFAPEEARKALFDPREKERRPSALGQVESFSDVVDRVDKAKASVDQVVMLGIIVLVTALLGAITAALFEIEPASGDGKATVVVHHASGAISRHVRSLPAPGPDAKTLALTFAAIVLVASILAIIATAAISIRTAGTRVNRKVRLRDGYPYGGT